MAHLLDINYSTDYPIPVDNLEPEEEPVTEEEAAGPAEAPMPPGALLAALEEAIVYEMGPHEHG